MVLVRMWQQPTGDTARPVVRRVVARRVESHGILERNLQAVPGQFDVFGQSCVCGVVVEVVRDVCQVGFARLDALDDVEALVDREVGGVWSVA